MLYPKRNEPLKAEDFKNPGSEYRATPFWAWNNKLDRDELLRQIDIFIKMGYGGFHMHVRTGLATPYLSDEYMENIRACVEKARQTGMLAWLYDEDRWPSGAAGGLVTKDPQYRQRFLRLTRVPKRPEGGAAESGAIKVFDVELDANGALAGYRSINENDPARGIKLFAYPESPREDPWYNNQTYVDTLNNAAIKEFIRVTYERYGDYFAKDFGNVVPAIFTDEPQFSKKETLNFAAEEKDVTLPWTDDLEETYRSAYHGESLTEGIPELLWNLSGGRISPIRYHYHDHIAERFAASFADQCGAWCNAHGLMLTGHMMEEPTLESQTHSLGEAMRSYRSFQLPGIDMLCDRREFTTAKQAQSAARQYGRPGVLSEIYGVTNWDFDFRGHKLQGDWQAALGVTVRVPHLSWVSMNGEAKRDYPATFNYQSPWYEEYSYVENHFARIAQALTRGKAVARVAVIHPVESYWLHWGDKENTSAIREQMEQNFLQLCDWLLRGFIDFDYISESLLPELCAIDAITGDEFPVGEMRYSCIIVPALVTIRQSTMERLEAFRNAGGRVIFLGDPPEYRDAYPNDGPLKLFQRSEHTGFERLKILNVLENVREVRARDDSGAEVQNLLYQLREEGDSRWFFAAQADTPVNPDIPAGRIIHLRFRGQWNVTHYNTLDGSISAAAASVQNGWTSISHIFYDHDSLLLKLDRITASAEKNSGTAPGLSDLALMRKNLLADEKPVHRFTDPVPVTLHEPNVLLLDMAEYALDDENYRGAGDEEILRIDNILREELDWPLRRKAVAQPWTEQDAAAPHRLRLRYTFESEMDFTGAELAMENADRATVQLNGKSAAAPAGWYVDKCIDKMKLPEIQKGRNVLELTIPYGRKVDPEAVYLLGDFGVKVSGRRCTLTMPVRTLAFGDICPQGLPFYGGNITYHLETENGGSVFAAGILAATCYRGHLLKVKVEGVDQGIIAYSPYCLKLNPSKPGPQKIDLVYYGSRINTFGQLHCVDRQSGYWWGPDSWRTIGANWTYEYKFWPQGVLKSPEIFAG
ncbi:hypothetical protein AGMMS49928_11900 [Spirochaetia bacterium]|nr:hypothetical protein AGMMS49928_11900 [Spirochaetia bacterium]